MQFDSACEQDAQLAGLLFIGTFSRYLYMFSINSRHVGWTVIFEVVALLSGNV